MRAIASAGLQGHGRLVPANHAVVVAEIVLLPASLGAPRTAGCFTALNALLMAVRIPAEEHVLAGAGEDRAKVV